MTRKLGVKGRQARPLEDAVMEKLLQFVESLHTGDKMEKRMMVLAIAIMKDGCFRWDDLVRVEFGDVLVTSQYARVFVSEGKTDAARKGAWKLVPRRDQPWSGYALLRRVAGWVAAEFSQLSEADKGAWLLANPEMSTWAQGRGEVALNGVRILCPLRKTQTAWLPAAAGVSLSYDTFQGRFRAMLGAVGEDPRGFSTHSMRRGGATELRGRDLPEELIAQHGGWRSAQCMRQYFDGTVEFSRRSAALQQAERSGVGPRETVVTDLACLED